MEKLLEALTDIWTAAGYLVLAVFGGIIAHVKEWETLAPQYTAWQHFWAIVRRALIATFAGLIWYFLMLGSQWQGKPFAYVGAALIGLFAPEFLDFLWAIFKERIMAVFNALLGRKGMEDENSKRG